LKVNSFTVGAIFDQREIMMEERQRRGPQMESARDDDSSAGQAIHLIVRV